jgi:hypothetical protein
MTKRFVPLAAACIAVLVGVLPAAAKTPPPTVVAKVGIEVAKLGLATGGIDTATSKCTSKAYGQIQTKTPRLTAIISSFKTKCR